MIFNRKLLCVALATASGSIAALEKPKTVEEMWRIIEAQQQQINELKTQVNQSPATTPAPVSDAGAQTGSNPAPVAQQANTESVKQLERKTDILSAEVEKLRTNLSIPEEAKYKSMYGLGPAASKVYQVSKGLSIGGYGEANYQVITDDKGTGKNNADYERFILYTGYKFTDSILFNSELEFEHSKTGGGGSGSVALEFAALDFFIDPMANVRAGMVLMPMGFINQIHEPPFFFGNNRPEVERQIIPSTWREIGGGLFGQITPELTYTAYVVNGLDASDFSSSGIRSGRQNGNKALAENLGYVVRSDYTPDFLPGVMVGGSFYLGNSGQGQSFGGVGADVFTQLYEGHIQWKYRGLEFRTLGAWGHIDNADILSTAAGETIGSSNFGWYTEVGYDVLPLLLTDTTQYLAPFFRFEQYDTLASVPSGFADNGNLARMIYQFGLHYKPIPNVVIKADYRNFTAKAGEVPDDFNIGVGFIF